MKRLLILSLSIFSLLAAVVILYFLNIIDMPRFAKVPVRVDIKAVRDYPFDSGEDIGNWQEKKLSSKETEYSLIEKDGKKFVKAFSDDSASALYMRKKFSSEGSPYISWDWMVEKFPNKDKKEVIEDKSEFDFGAQVYVIFHAAFFLNAKAIQYVWCEELPEGITGSSPYTDNVRIMVLASGEPGKWRHEQRDIRADYRELFGEDTDKDIEAVSFMTDADSTGTTAVAYYDNFKLGYLDTQTVVSGPGERIKPEVDRQQRLRGIYYDIRKKVTGLWTGIRDNLSGLLERLRERRSH